MCVLKFEVWDIEMQINKAQLMTWTEIHCVYICVSVCITELQTTQAFEFYTLSEKAMDYRILFMDEDQDRMYVGCKDHVLSMDINNITHGTLKVSL